MRSDNSRVTSLPGTPGADSSGVGQLLFDRMDEQYKQTQNAKQLDVLEGIRSKYAVEHAAKANEYSQGMEKLRNDLTMARTEASWAQVQQLKTQEATGLQHMLQGMNTNIPGLTTQNQDPEYMTGSGRPQYDANTINPNAVQEARELLHQKLLQTTKLQEQRDSISLMPERDRMARELDLTSSDDAKRATILGDQFISTGDTLLGNMIKARWGTEGVGSSHALKTFEERSLPDWQKAQATMSSRESIAADNNARAVTVANIRASAMAALRKPLNDMAYKELGSLHSAYQAQSRGITANLRRMSEQLELETDPKIKLNLRHRMHELELSLAEVTADSEKLRDRMLQHSYGQTDQTTQPGQTSPGTKPSSAPGDQQDRLGILPKRKP